MTQSTFRIPTKPVESAADAKADGRQSSPVETTDPLRNVRETAAADERVRLGGLLHDSILQSLGAGMMELACLKLSLLASADSTATHAVVPFSTLLRHCNSLERLMRLVASDLRGWLQDDGRALPVSFTEARRADGDLLGALRWLVVRRLGFALDVPWTEPPRSDIGRDYHHRDGDTSRTPPAVCVQVRGEPVTLAPEMEVEVLAVVQEALLNAHRHGHARTILVTADLARGEHAGTDLADALRHAQPSGDPATSFILQMSAPSFSEVTPVLKLMVLDDGRPSSGGFVREGGALTLGGYGLRSMHDRATRLGAKLQIAAAEVGGVCVSLEVPLGRSTSIRGAAMQTAIPAPVMTH